MAYLLDLIRECGLLSVFGNVPVEQTGAPVPAHPTRAASTPRVAAGQATDE